MTKDEALKMAIVAIQSALSNQGTMLLSDPPQSAWKFYGCDNKLKEAFEACKEALAQTAQEPYRCHWVEKGKGHCERNKRMGFADDYGHPAPSWQKLSDDEIVSIWVQTYDEKDIRQVCRAIEQALRNKNGY